MALSNIFNEPRREITESAVGIAVVGGFVWGDYAFALWLETAFRVSDRVGGPPWPIGMLLGIALVMLIVAAVVLSHALGDVICNALEDRDIHLRPRQRR